jgi:Zn-dependent protease
VIRAFGVPVRIEWSWAPVALAAGGAFALRAAASGATTAAAVSVGMLGAVLLTGSVLVHEAGHAAVARRAGIAVRDVRVFVFGGSTEMEGEPATPRAELAVAAAGPAASALFGGVLWAAALPVGAAVGDMLVTLAIVNLAVAAFNLLPGLPLDGGRIVRAAVWASRGDPDPASRVAAAAGVVVGAGIAVAGVVAAFLGEPITTPVYLAVGAFVAGAAAAAGRTTGTNALPVESVMEPPGRVIDAGLPATPPSPGEPPAVVVAGGRVVGLMPASSGGIVPLRRRDLVDAGTPIGAVLPRLRRGRHLVVVSGGRMVGVLPPSLRSGSPAPVPTP